MYEFVQRGVMQEVERRLSAQGRKCLPEVFFIGDDFAAAGALSALDHFGISIPEDVRFVSWSTAGTGPFYRKSLTRFEVDPVNEGRRLLDEMTGFLDGRGLPPDMAVDIKYVIGESFPE